MTRKWWQDAVIYQVYLRSFNDSNNDGIGDLQGVIEKLPYIKSLGANTVWISPHYDSPMDDNGYDVRDFFKVSEDYGDLDDFKALLDSAHDQGIKIIIDLVLNHTSDEHPWFEAAKDPAHPKHEKYHDYYIWQPPKDMTDGVQTLPTNWRSWFGGPVWEYNALTHSYYLHIFSKKMPDLNWRNKNMIQDMMAMIQWWIDLGVDGFRVDASNHLEKNWDFPDAYPGYEHFSSLPKHHDYLKLLGEQLFFPNNLMTIGESGGASPKEALQYAGFDSKEFNMLIQFGHCWADIDDANHITPGKWAKGTINVPHIKQSLAHWINVFEDKGQNTLYWHNHDHPRVVSHYGSDTFKTHEISAKMLAYSLYLLPGTPIIYQGEEIGMTNVDYQQLNDFRDVEVYTEYANFIQLGATHEVAMQALRDRARDNARSPMQWDNTLHGGFSEYTPWMATNQNKDFINVRQQENDKNSILNTYRNLIALRKSEDLAFAKTQFYDLDHAQSFHYQSKGKYHTYVVISNFSDQTMVLNDLKITDDYTLYLSNTRAQERNVFKPYEARIYRKKH